MRVLAVLVALLVTSTAVAAPDAHEPATIVIVVDRTMGAKTDAVRGALADAVSVLAADDRIAVVGVDAKAQVVVPMQWAKDRDGFVRKLAGLGRGSGVNVPAGVEAARALLAPMKGRKQIVVITDTTSVTGMSGLYKKLKHDGIVVSAVGVESLNRTALESIAYDVNGRVYAIEDVTGLAGILRDESTRALPSVQVALVVVVDRSSAMQGSRLEAAKEITRVAIERMDIDDQVGVISFDTTAMTWLPLAKPEKRLQMSAEIARLTAGGGSQLFHGLLQAKQTLAGSRLQKRVVLISLGRGPMDGVADLVDQMAADGITVSVFGTFGADRDTLAPIAEHGKGRLQMLDDGIELDEVFKDMRR